MLVLRDGCSGPSPSPISSSLGLDTPHHACGPPGDQCDGPHGDGPRPALTYHKPWHGREAGPPPPLPSRGWNTVRGGEGEGDAAQGTGPPALLSKNLEPQARVTSYCGSSSLSSQAEWDRQAPPGRAPSQPPRGSLTGRVWCRIPRGCLPGVLSDSDPHSRTELLPSGAEGASLPRAGPLAFVLPSCGSLAPQDSVITGQFAATCHFFGQGRGCAASWSSPLSQMVGGLGRVLRCWRNRYLWRGRLQLHLPVSLAS